MNADYVDAVQADSISEIRGLSNLIMQTDTNAHERETAGGPQAAHRNPRGSRETFNT